MEKKSKTPNQHLYISYTVKNPDFIIQFNREKKNQMRKYHKLIRKIETIANIQLQIQYIIKQANVVNNQLADIKNIEIIILQTEKEHKI